MIQHKTPIVPNTRNEAEGTSPDSPEPDAPFRTSTMPNVRTFVAPTSETGITKVVNINAEGSDDNEKQDASRPEDQTETQPKSAAENDPSGKTALIVEDNVDLAEVLQATLQSMNMNAVYETHGENGLQRLKELQPDLLLMDISLPDITGWKMLDRIKEHAAHSQANMPFIIVMTAYGDPANRLVGKLQGIHSYLIKPFKPDEVERVVQAVLSGKAGTPFDSTQDEQPTG